MELLDKYKIIRVLGSGAFGKVLLAYDELAKHEVAIKTYINTDFTEDDIIRELQFLASLKHPSIVTFYHHFIHNSMLHLVMEYCIGGSLDNLLRKGNLEIDEALRICIDISDALTFIHNKAIIHRDIKPGNILFDENHRPKLSDFGVSNTQGGTYLYLPPEVFFSEHSNSKEPQTDIYSLGIVLLEMVVGHNPFNYIAKEDVISAKINQSFIPGDLPHWLQEIILKSTHPSPEFRFQTAKDFSNALKSKSAPYTINKKIIKADKLFAYAEKCLTQKKWNKSVSYIKKGVEISKDSVLGNITSAKYYLKTHNLPLAKKYFEKALSLNPGVNIKKELSSIHLDEGNFAQAVLLLQNHIQLNPIDWEAYNLLLECYFRMNRFDLALDIYDSILLDTKLDCFWNNWLISHLCNGTITKEIISKAIDNSKRDHFILFNTSIYGDDSKSWSELSEMKNKFLYQSFRFNNFSKSNNIRIEFRNKNIEFSAPIISIGRNKDNNFVVDDSLVSRRHCALINYSKDVWINDLGSTHGISVDGKKVVNKQFLLGKHKINIGDFSFNLYTSEDVLL